MKTLSTDAFVFSVLTIMTVLGCGVMPPGQASTKSFTVTGFSLPVSMAYSEMVDVRAQVPGISVSRDAAQSFVSRLVMQTVLDVLERQGRSAGLPDAIIAAILGQLSVHIRYEALECKKATVNLADPTMQFPGEMGKLPHCIIFDSTITALCTAVNNGQPDMCKLSDNMGIVAISSEHRSISGTLTLWRIGREKCGKMSLIEPFECWRRARLDRTSFQHLQLSAEMRVYK